MTLLHEYPRMIYTEYPFLNHGYCTRHRRFIPFKDALYKPKRPKLALCPFCKNPLRLSPRNSNNKPERKRLDVRM